MYPASESLLPIAQVLKSYGTEGEVIISFYSNDHKNINKKEAIFIFFDGLSVPFFISAIQNKGTNKAQVKFEFIDSLEAAEELVSKKLHIPAEKLGASDTNDESTKYGLLGYTLVDQNNNTIGIIKDIHNYSGNVCLIVDEYLIPFHKEIIIKKDTKSRILILNIPEGLI